MNDATFSGSEARFKIQYLCCNVHNNYTEAVVGNEILKSQAPSNNAQRICTKKITQVKGELKDIRYKTVQRFKI